MDGENPMSPKNDPVRLIAVDVDGTLLNSQHQMSKRTERALKEALARRVAVVLATGKTYYSAREVRQRLRLTTPGIYLQGLLICEADGTVRRERTLAPEIVRRMVEFAEETGHTLVAYSRMRVLAGRRNEHTDKLRDYHEPEPEIIGSLRGLADSTPVNKIILFTEPESIEELRKALKSQVDGTARVVQSLPDVLEILPPGASKGEALRLLLNDLGVDPRHVMAIGNAENDVEMLRVAGIGVAVGNATPPALAAADHVVASNDEDGVAEAVERFVLGKGTR